MSITFEARTVNETEIQSYFVCSLSPLKGHPEERVVVRGERRQDSVSRMGNVVMGQALGHHKKLGFSLSYKGKHMDIKQKGI